MEPVLGGIPGVDWGLNFQSDPLSGLVEVNGIVDTGWNWGHCQEGGMS